MKRVIHKLFFNWSAEKEEDWLNDMARHGLRLIDVGFCTYVFAEAEPARYQYRIELLDAPFNSPRSLSYKEFMQEMGVNTVGHYRSWVYFEKEVDGRPFAIYSDSAAQLEHCRRQVKALTAALALTLCLALCNIILYVIDSSTINLICGLLLAALGAAAVVGLLQKRRMLRHFEKEKTLHE